MTQFSNVKNTAILVGAAASIVCGIDKIKDTLAKWICEYKNSKNPEPKEESDV